MDFFLILLDSIKNTHVFQSAPCYILNFCLFADETIFLYHIHAVKFESR